MRSNRIEPTILCSSHHVSCIVHRAFTFYIYYIYYIYVGVDIEKRGLVTNGREEGFWGFGA